MNTKKNCIIRETLNLWTDAGSKPKQRWATQTWSYLFPLQEPSFFLYKNLACSLYEAKSDKINKKIIFFGGDFWPFPNKNVQNWDHFFPILIPKDSKSLKSCEIGLEEVGEKRSLNGVNLACSCTRTYFVSFTRQDTTKRSKQQFFVRRFYIISKQQCSNMRPLLSIIFSQVFWIFKKFRDWTLGNGCKKRFKWSEQSVTYTQTHICTLRLIYWIGLGADLVKILLSLINFWEDIPYCVSVSDTSVQ